MSDGPFQRLRQFLAELKRRKVYRVAAVYAGVAFVTLQAARLIFPATTLEGVYDVLVVIAFVGFPIAVVLAWAFEVTPEGVRRTPAAEPAEKAEASAGETRTAYKFLVGLGLLAAAVAGGWYLTGSGGQSTEITEGTVAVLPFQVSGPGTESWREGMVTMLGTGLDGAAGLRAIADQTVLAAWERAGQATSPPDMPRYLEAARRVGAQYAIVGSAAKLGGELQLSADVHEARSGDRLGQVEVRGSPEQVTSLTDSLTRRVLTVLLEEAGQEIPSVNLGRLTTSSLPALKSYLAGERHYRAGEFESAVEDYQSAVAEDSTFALAYARLALTHGWLVNLKEADQYWSRSYELLSRLPARDRGIVQGQYLWQVAGRPLAAADTLRRLAKEYPDDPSVWYTLGEVVFHNAVPRGKPQADRAFGRAVDLDSGMAPYHQHYVALAAAVHHDSGLAARRNTANPGRGYESHRQRGLALVFGSHERRDEVLAAVDSINPGPFFLQHPTDGPIWIRYVQKEVDHPRAFLWWRPAGAYVRQGQIQEGLDHLDDEGGTRTDQACLLAYASTWRMPVPDSLLRRYLEPARLPHDASARRLKCSGLYLVDQGRDDELPELLDRLRSAADSVAKDLPPAARLQEDLLNEVRGYDAYRAGDLKRAASLWEGANESQHWGAVWRGDLYRKLGQLERAEGWYFAAWPMPLAHHRLGRLYEEMDKPEKAAAAYRRFIAAWEDADPELQPRVEAARKRLQQLTASEAGTNE